jgi:sodium transport system permease protein
MAVTGAFYPAVDLAAGEKERGTMETLLICPATRSELVIGKFLTVMLFSLCTALLNLISAGVTGKYMASIAGAGAFSKIGDLALPTPMAMVWVLVLAIPLAALFSALCLALATFARSSKEGQHYLTPLLTVTMGLTVVCLSPAVEIEPLYSIMPVIGPALLLKELLATGGSAEALMYVVPVLVSSFGYSLLALWWAVDLFSREDVLFREAERFEIKIWLRHLLRDKEPTPSFTEAGICFVMIMFLQFGALKFMSGIMADSAGMSPDMVMMKLLVMQQLVIIATPALFMGILLTSSVRRTFRIRWPNWRFLAVAAALPLVLHPLSLELAARMQGFFPPLPKSIQDVAQTMTNPNTSIWFVLLAFAVIPAVCE